MLCRSALPWLLILYGCQTTAPLTTVVVVRHAEKQKDGTRDPALTELGQVRADRLAAMLKNAGPGAIFATQYLRTQQTVQPLSKAASVPLVEVDAGSTAELAKRILAEHRGQTVVVAGHSNTVNRLIADLGGPKMPDLDDEDYDNLFVLTVAGDRAKLLKMAFGLTSSTARPIP